LTRLKFAARTGDRRQAFKSGPDGNEDAPPRREAGKDINNSKGFMGFQKKSIA